MIKAIKKFSLSFINGFTNRISKRLTIGNFWPHSIFKKIFNVIANYIIFIIIGAFTATFVSPLNWWWCLVFGVIFFTQYIMHDYDSDLKANEFNNTKQYTEYRMPSRLFFSFFNFIFFLKYFIYCTILKGKKFNNPKQYRRLKFIKGWLFGYGYYLFLFHWIATPLFIGGIGKYYLLLPFAWIVVPALLGLHFGFTAYITACLLSFSKSKYISLNIKILTAGLVWGVLEYIRLQIIPFYPMSFVLLNSLALSQIFYYVHPVILSYIIFQMFMYFGFFALSIKIKKSISIWKELAVYFFISVFGLSIIMLEYFFSASNPMLNLVSADLQLSGKQQKIAANKIIKSKIIIIQPNISQSVKNNADHIDSEIEKLYEKTKTIAKKHKDALIIWPEASIPFRVDMPFFYNYSSADLASLVSDTELLDMMESSSLDSKGLKSAPRKSNNHFYTLQMVYENNNDKTEKLVKRLIFKNRMIVGLDADFIKALFSNNTENDTKSSSFTGGLLMGINTFDIRDNQVYTSTALFAKKPDSTQSTIQQIYDKINLIPFGEYVPMRNWLPNWSFIKAMAATIGDYKAGKSSPIHYWRGKRLAVLICYEGLFDIPYTSLDCEQGVNKCSLDAIIHISNDGWFGNSFCLYQDLDHARVKAIQYNCKVLRCLNTGISAEIDRYGRVLKSLSVEKSGVLESDL